MDLTQIAFLGLLFVAVTAGAFYVMSLFSRSPTAERLSAIAGDGKASAGAGADAWIERTVKLTNRSQNSRRPRTARTRRAARALHARGHPPRVGAARVLRRQDRARARPAAGHVFRRAGVVPGLQFQGTLFVVLLAATLGYYAPNIVLNG